jgi:hypothetical protein
VKTPKAG